MAEGKETTTRSPIQEPFDVVFILVLSLFSDEFTLPVAVFSPAILSYQWGVI